MKMCALELWRKNSPIFLFSNWWEHHWVSQQENRLNWSNQHRNITSERKSTFPPCSSEHLNLNLNLNLNCTENLDELKRSEQKMGSRVVFASCHIASSHSSCYVCYTSQFSLKFSLRFAFIYWVGRRSNYWWDKLSLFGVKQKMNMWKRTSCSLLSIVEDLWCCGHVSLWKTCPH